MSGSAALRRRFQLIASTIEGLWSLVFVVDFLETRHVIQAPW